jgi:hypothetical protein
MPSEKYTFSGSSPTFLKGSTATDVDGYSGVSAGTTTPLRAGASSRGPVTTSPSGEISKTHESTRATGRPTMEMTTMAV